MRAPAFFPSEADVASIGQEVISVEIVVGADSAAGLAVEKTSEQTEPEVAAVEPSKEEPPPRVENQVVEEPMPEEEERPLEREREPPPPPPKMAAVGGVGRGRSELSVSYQSRIAAHLARHKRFPPEARNRDNQGRLIVSFTLDSSGGVTSVQLIEGVGVESLDQEATAMVKRASPFPPPPGGQAVTFTVPIRFKLN